MRAANVLAVTKGAIYVCMSSSELHTLHQAFTDAGGYWSTFVIWAKHHFTLGRSDYQRQYEPIIYGWRKGIPRQLPVQQVLDHVRVHNLTPRTRLIVPTGFR